MIIKYGCICPLALQTAGKKRGTLMKEFIICLCYAAGLGVLSFFLGRLLPKRWLHPDKFPFRTYAWEEKLWKALQIRKWQAKVPDMSRLFKKLMPGQKPSRRRPRRIFL